MNVPVVLIRCIFEQRCRSFCPLFRGGRCAESRATPEAGIFGMGQNGSFCPVIHALRANKHYLLIIGLAATPRNYTLTDMHAYALY
jgi:hypothetical protein